MCNLSVNAKLCSITIVSVANIFRIFVFIQGNPPPILRPELRHFFRFIPQRYVIAWFGFLAIANAFAMRIVLCMTIVRMTGNEAGHSMFLKIGFDSNVVSG